MSSKVVKFIEFLDMGIFPGTVLFAYGYEYDALIGTIDQQYKKKVWASNQPFWSLGIRDDKDLIDKGNYMALRRVLSHGNTGEEKVLFYLIIKEQFKFTDYDMCKLAHELVHICQFFLPDILDRNREIEAEAYLHTHLMEQALKHLRK